MPDLAAASQVPLDLLAWPMANELAACLCIEAKLEDACFCGVYPGSRAPYELAGACEESCGAGYVRLDRAYPSTAFPAEATAATCATRLAFRFTVGVLRCFPGSLDAEVPEQAMFTNWAEAQYADMAAIRRAIKCCFGTKFEDQDYVLGAWVPVPLQAGVGGGEWQVVVEQAT